MQFLRAIVAFVGLIAPPMIAAAAVLYLYETRAPITFVVFVIALIVWSEIRRVFRRPLD